MAKKKDDIHKWYVLRTFSGHEKKVRRYIERELDRLELEDHIDEMLIPTETVFEMRGGKKKTKEKTLYPGYLILHAVVDSELQHVITGLPSVIGFVGGGGDPQPLREIEVKRMLGKMDEAAEMGERPEIPYKAGDPVKVVDGPFNSFTGFIQEVYPDKMKVKVMVSIFGRKTPLELDYLQVEHEE